MAVSYTHLMGSGHHFIEKFLDQSTIMPHILHIPFLGQLFALCGDLRHQVRQSLLQFCFFHMARQHELEAAIRGRCVDVYKRQEHSIPQDS